MVISVARRFLLTAGSLVLISMPLFLLQHNPGAAAPAPATVLSEYLKAVYARDYQRAYRFISDRDRRLKPEEVYVRERGAFSGFTLVVARRLAEFIELEPAQVNSQGDRRDVRVAVKLPDAGSLAPLLMDWEEEKLNALPPAEQRKMLGALNRLHRSGTMKMITGEESFTLVKENRTWRVVLDWDTALRVSFDARVPLDKSIEAEPVSRDTLVTASEPFRITYRVTNHSDQTLRARIVHKIDPPELREYLDIVECALLLPVSIAAGEAAEYSSTYLLRSDLPERTRRLNVTYEFKIER